MQRSGERITLADHDRLLADYPRPKGFVASKRIVADNNLSEGDAADPRHDLWIIRSDDPEKVIDADVWLDFGLPIHAGGTRLTDPARASDLLTAKLVVLESMYGQHVGWLAAKPIRGLFYNLCWIFRWRLALGVETMSQVTPDLFADFCDRLRHGVYNLIPFDERVGRLERRLEAGEHVLPATCITVVHRSISKCFRPTLASL